MIKNTKAQFIEWSTDCQGWNKEDIDEAIKENDYQIINYISDDIHTLNELKNYLS